MDVKPRVSVPASRDPASQSGDIGEDHFSHFTQPRCRSHRSKGRRTATLFHPPNLSLTLRILIDIQSLQSPSANRGIGRYSRALIEGLLRQAPNDQIILLLNGKHRSKDKRLTDEERRLLQRRASPSLALGTVNPNKINNLERNFGVYGTTFM